jgi:NitT/TauT family transport system substrate-binding protein
MKKSMILMAMLLVIAGGLVWVGIVRRPVVKTPVVTKDVKIQLKWLHQAQFAGNYVALEKGFYKDDGLNVSLLPYDFKKSVIDSVLQGDADFGVAGADELIMARVAGKPVKAIAVIYKVSPVTAFALKSSGITKPQDFIGKRVGIERGQNVEYLYRAMMEKLGISLSKMNEVSIGYDAKELMTGKVEVSTGYVINEPQLAVEAGYAINTILMADYGVNMYADVLFTTEETINTKPDLVYGFVAGTLSGWQYALEHETEAVDLTMKYAKDTSVNHQSYMLTASTPLINTGSTRIGWMELPQWEQSQNILFEQKLIDKKVNINDAFTMQFVNQYYK